MTFPSTNPRRSYKTRAFPMVPSCPPSPTHHVSLSSEIIDAVVPLKKSSTFHSRSSPPAEDDPIVSIPLLAKRSPTSRKNLEDAVAAGERRIADLIGQLDRSLSGLDSLSSDTQKTVAPDDLPVPRFMIDAHVNDPSHMDVDKPEPIKTHRRKHHSSDSGIGSSVTTSDEMAAQNAGKWPRHDKSLRRRRILQLTWHLA